MNIDRYLPVLMVMTGSCFNLITFKTTETGKTTAICFNDNDVCVLPLHKSMSYNLFYVFQESTLTSHGIHDKVQSWGSTISSTASIMLGHALNTATCGSNTQTEVTAYDKTPD